METTPGDNPALAPAELLQTQRSLGGDRGGHARRAWFTNWVLERRLTGKNVLAVITGELGIGKSYMGLSLCRYFDPSFSVDKVVFLGSDFMKAVQAADKGSWVLFDEPNLGIGHRTFMNIVNRTVAGFVQASRFLGVNAVFALPTADLMDTAVVRVAHIRIRVTARGWGKVERIKHSEFEGGPRIRFKGMGTLKVGLPPRILIDAYEDKRKAFHTEFFKSEGIADLEHGFIPTAKRDYLNEILSNPDAFMEADSRNPSQKKLSNKMIVGKLRVNKSKATELKQQAEVILSQKQSLIQS